MAVQDTSLKGVVTEALRETQDTIKVDTTNQDGLSKANSEETNTGETAEKEYVEGVDISDIPVGDRPRIKAKLEEKARLLKTGYDTKFQEVAKFKKAQEELIGMGLSVDEAQSVLIKHIEQKRNPVKTTEQKKEASRLLDKLMEQAPDQKQSLEQLRTIVLEETNFAELSKKITDMEKVLQHYQLRDMEIGEQNIIKDLDALVDKFGDIIPKYKDAIIGEWKKHPNIKAKDILKYIVPDDEYEQAILSKGKKPVTPEKKNATMSKTSGVSGSIETIDVKKTSMKDILGTLLKK